MKYVLAMLGMALSIGMILKREAVGNALGQADWMRKFGGIYGIVVFVAILIFFWSLAVLTGTTEIFFKPIYLVFPFIAEEAPPPMTF